MWTLSFLLAAALAIVLPWGGLLWLRERLGLEPFWYGLTLVGAGAAVVAVLVQMGLWLVYVSLAPIPAQLTPSELASRWDVLLFTAFLYGPLAEGCKAQAVVLLHERMTRGSWPLRGLSVGVGAGLLQSVWLLGAVGWVVVTGQAEAGPTSLWLAARCFALTGMEGVGAMVALWGRAKGRGWPWVLGVGCLHGAARLAGQLPWTGEGALEWLAAPLYALVVALMGAWLWRKVRQEGWPT